MLSRRRFLTFASAACLVASPVRAFRWYGTALGARAQIILDHPRAQEITRRALAEINRLEEVFSLYRPDSDLVRLNRTGALPAPAFEMLECLSIARRVHQATEGRFDPTVQPLWRVLAQAANDRTVPAPAALEAARRSIGFDRVTFGAAAVRLGSGQALTLNGIAQGYVADRVARLMQAEGVADVLIDTGEIVAMGAPAGSDGWPVTIAGTPHPRPLTARALATSARFAGGLDANGGAGHILDPRAVASGEPALLQVSISARSAALADALSTGLCLASSPAMVRRLMHGFADARLEHLGTHTDTI